MNIKYTMCDRHLINFCIKDDLENVKRILEFRRVVRNITITDAFTGACAHGSTRVVEYLMQNANIYKVFNNQYTIRTATQFAAKNGHLHIIKLLSHLWVPDQSYDCVMTQACSNGNMDLICAVIQLLESHQTSDMYHYGLIGACKSNNITLVKLMLEKITRPIFRTIWESVYTTNNPELIALILQRVPVSWPNAFLGACLGKHLELARDIYAKYGPFNNDSSVKGLALLDAAENGDIEMYKFTKTIVDHHYASDKLYAVCCGKPPCLPILDDICRDISDDLCYMHNTKLLLFSDPELDIGFADYIVSQVDKIYGRGFYEAAFPYAIDSYNIPVIKTLLLREVGHVMHLQARQLPLLVDAGIPMKYFTDRYLDLPIHSRIEVEECRIMRAAYEAQLRRIECIPRALTYIIMSYLPHSTLNL